MVAKDESHTVQAAPSSGDDLPPARFEDAEPDVSAAPKAVALDEQVAQDGLF